MKPLLAIPLPHPSASLHVWQRYQYLRDQASRQAWQTSCRTPPRPPYTHHPGRVCRLCGRPVEGRRRTWCSDECVALWFIATDSGYAARHLLQLHGHQCWTCGATEENGDRWDLRWPEAVRDVGPPAPQAVVLEVEHVRPLWSLEGTERGDLRWWLPFNLQMLCRPCHRARSRAEAAERAALRRVGRP